MLHATWQLAMYLQPVYHCDQFGHSHQQHLLQWQHTVFVLCSRTYWVQSSPHCCMHTYIHTNAYIYMYMLHPHMYVLPTTFGRLSFQFLPQLLRSFVSQLESSISVQQQQQYDTLSPRTVK